MNEKKNKISLTVNVNAPAQRVWEVISDYSNVQRYNPLIKNTTILSRNDQGVCAKRRCEFYDNSSNVEEVTLWIEDKGFTINLTETSIPFDTAKVNIRVDPTDSASSNITMEMDYTIKYGFIGKMLNTLILRKRIMKLFGQVINGLVQYVTTIDDHEDYMEKQDVLKKELAFSA